MTHNGTVVLESDTFKSEDRQWLNENKKNQKKNKKASVEADITDHCRHLSF